MCEAIDEEAPDEDLDAPGMAELLKTMAEAAHERERRAAEARRKAEDEAREAAEAAEIARRAADEAERERVAEAESAPSNYSGFNWGTSFDDPRVLPMHCAHLAPRQRCLACRVARHSARHVCEPARGGGAPSRAPNRLPHASLLAPSLACVPARSSGWRTRLTRHESWTSMMINSWTSMMIKSWTSTMIQSWTSMMIKSWTSMMIKSVCRAAEPIRFATRRWAVRTNGVRGDRCGGRLPPPPGCASRRTARFVGGAR